MNWYKEAKKVEHNYSWVYIDLPKDIQSQIIAFGEEIDPDDLFTKEADGGIERTPHITVKYGLLTEDIKDIKECLEGLKGGKAHMGSSSIFEGDKYDVVKITVESKALANLHNNLNQLPHEDKHMEYNAHATIAYAKKGKGKKYNKKFKLNKSFRFGEVFFGNNKKDFTIKLAHLTSFNKQAMALDPDAYKTETQPARLPQHQDIAHGFNPMTGKSIPIPQRQNPSEIESLYSGVHFAFNPEHAAIYAIGKATKEDPPVIIEIEPKGLKQQPDVDAMMDQRLTYYLDDKKNEWQPILQSGKDQQTIADEIYDDIVSDLGNWTEEGDVYDTADDIILKEQVPIPPSVIRDLIINKSPQQIINTINQLISGKISNKLLIRMVGQMRVNNNIDSSRVKAIYQVPWVDLSAEATQDPYGMADEQLKELMEEKGWHQEGDDIINEKGQIVPSYESLMYNQWLDLTPLYKNNQLYFKGYTSKDSIWHGTTLSRAKSAYPELLGGSVVAKTESWYKPPFMRAMNYVGVPNEKKDISASIPYKYTVANEQKAELKPYYIVTIREDGDVPVASLKNVRVRAYSSEQARMKFLDKYLFLRDYRLLGIDVEARVDDAMWQAEQRGDAAKKQIAEENIQNAWWNK